MPIKTLTPAECQNLDLIVDGLDLEEVGFSDFASLLNSVVAPSRLSELDLESAYDEWVDFVE